MLYICTYLRKGCQGSWQPTSGALNDSRISAIRPLVNTQPERNTQVLPMPTSRTIRLMLVDDHPVMRAGLANLLGVLQKDFQVVAQADDGESAIALWQRHRPDVCLLDVSMHGIDGIETMRRELLRLRPACSCSPRRKHRRTWRSR